MKFKILIAFGLAVCGCAHTTSRRDFDLSDAFQPAVASQNTFRDNIFKQVTELTPLDHPKSQAEQMASMAGREDLDREELSSEAALRCIPLADDPLKLIAQKARRTSIVIINEDHASPRHRWFIGEVLKVLKKEGYSTYAAETFSADGLGHGLVANMGYYVKDPIFGRVVSLANELGYHFVAYDVTSANEQPPNLSRNEKIEWREQVQVNNLMDAIFRMRPDAKVVIHMGFSHVNEEPIPNSPQAKTAWMANRLKAATGIDPLTISQTGCRSPNGSIVAATERTGQVGLSTEQHVDMFIGHPNLVLKNRRATWRFQIGDAEVQVPPELLSRSERVIVEARRVGQKEDTVPVDRVLLFPGESLPLLLPHGLYRVESFSEGGTRTTAHRTVAVR